MKKLLSVLLLFAFCFPMARGQTTVTFPSGPLASEAFVRSYVDSVLSSRPVLEVPPASEQPALVPCEAGPELRTITHITENSLSAIFHGINVFGIDWQIHDQAGVVQSGSIRPTSSTLSLTFPRLEPGPYRLKLIGATCQGQSEKEFRIPQKSTGALPPIPPANPRLDGSGTHELFMNLTGYGYNPDEPSGMSPEWVERIEAFRYDWGWGITGIRLCLRWYEWEPTEGQYTRQGLQKVIDYCQQRGLKLAVFFWPWRQEGDGFIPADHLIRGHRGQLHLSLIHI